MEIKLTWERIYKNFRKHFPTLAKRVTYWHPHDYATIEIYLDDGSKILYNFDFDKVTFIKERWMPEKV